MLDFEFDRPKYKVIAIGPMYDDEEFPEERFDKKLEHLLNCGDDADYVDYVDSMLIYVDFKLIWELVLVTFRVAKRAWERKQYFKEMFYSGASNTWKQYLMFFSIVNYKTQGF